MFNIFVKIFIILALHHFGVNAIEVQDFEDMFEKYNNFSSNQINSLLKRLDELMANLTQLRVNKFKGVSSRGGIMLTKGPKSENTANDDVSDSSKELQNALERGLSNIKECNDLLDTLQERHDNLENSLKLQTKTFQNIKNLIKEKDPNEGSHYGKSSDNEEKFRDCAEIFLANKKSSNGLYKIYLGDEPIFAYCEKCRHGGLAFTIILENLNKDTDYLKSNDIYAYDLYAFENGFGNLHLNYFIGLDVIHKMSYTKVYELEITDKNDHIGFYDYFAVENSYHSYRLSALGELRGLAADLLHDNVGKTFVLDIDCPNAAFWTCGTNNTFLTENVREMRIRPRKH